MSAHDGGRGRVPEDPAVRGGGTDGPDWRGDDAPGWAGGVMAVLRFLTRLVEVNLFVAAGTLAGGVLLGLGPALRAGSAVLHDPELALEPWRGFWREWRTGWRRSNLLFAPLWPVGVLLWADAAAVGQASGPAHAAMLAGLTLASAWTAVVLAWWPRIVLRYDDAAPAVWRYLLLTPLTAPGAALAILVTLAATAAVILGVPLAALAAGASFPLWATGKVVDGTVRRNEPADSADSAHRPSAS
ncbi:YesL family protein [Myceligenerans pegani]|uniref:DUF624 domain-containing protein n=1 Tax=Myceligenerans pegani TaxID=2776917 RepID=A0ABR9N5L5_9MICO|nr:DUF624 domain-containing protein [Myceligenerans sp. TRM 65318]MBE1878650.1 DUF624 domain-containing protein [Myceligenerans sp. TRM 65318]MBE3020921.1 DUF624 domain-containing protein [Myceligenerans sp. TRM 65318]